MKYFLQSKATGDVIVNADTIEEAWKLAKAYKDNHFDEAIVLDEEGDLVDNYTMTKVQENGCTFYAIYSETERKYFAGYDFMGSIDWVENLNDAYWMDDAEAYQIMADLKAAAEPAYPETKQDDPQIKSLQIAMDYAWNRRNDEYNALENIRKNGPDFMLDKQYAEYRASQAFYEGICMAIFAAGYQIRTDDHETGKSTVLKK